MKKTIFIIPLLLFFACSNDEIPETNNFVEDDIVNESLLTNDNKIALHAFLEGVDFLDPKTRANSASKSIKMRYYSSASGTGNCFPLEAYCFPDLIVTPKLSIEAKIDLWESTEEGQLIKEEVNKGNYSVEKLSNENGIFIFYMDEVENDRQIVVQLK